MGEAVPMDEATTGITTSGKRASESRDDEGSSPGRDGSPSKKRRRISTSCDECRRRKIKCDKVSPCGPCVKRGDAFICENSAAIIPPAGALALQTLLAQAPRDAPATGSNIVFTLAQRMLDFERNVMPRLARLEENSAKSATAGSPSETPSAQQEPAEDDTEDAVLTLEDIALGTVGFPRSYDKLGMRNEAVTLGVRGSPVSSFVALSPTAQPQTVACSIRLQTPDETSLYKTSLSSVMGSPMTMLVDSIMHSIPSRMPLDLILETFRDVAQFRFHILHWPTFESQMTEFWSLIGTQQRYSIDPAWLAVLCVILSVGAKFVDKPSRQRLGWDDAEYNRIISYWFATSQLALTVADWSGKAQIRCIQTIILYASLLANSASPFLAHSASLPSTGADGGQFNTFLAAAINMARRLGLDQLGSSELTMPVDDPAWPPGSNALKREQARRLWAMLFALDSKINAADYKRCFIHPESFTTALPLRCNDAALGLELHPALAGGHVFCDQDYLLYQCSLAQHLRRCAKLIQGGQKITYEQILSLDTAFRPAFELIALDYGRPPAADDYKRGSLSAALHNRLLRLHRPFFVQGLLKPAQLRFSAKTALDCARVILLAYNVPAVRPLMASSWWTYAHCLGAALILHTKALHDLCHPSVSSPYDNAANDAELLAAAREFFRHAAADASIETGIQDLARHAGLTLDAIAQARFTRSGDEQVSDLLRRVANETRLNSAKEDAGVETMNYHLWGFFDDSPDFTAKLFNGPFEAPLDDAEMLSQSVGLLPGSSVLDNPSQPSFDWMFASLFPQNGDVLNMS